MTGHSVVVGLVFETAHRLPQLKQGRCASVHGHSWRAEVSIAAAQLAGDGTLVEFGALKTALRAVIDSQLDHATMLGAADPLVPALQEEGCRIFRFGVAEADAADAERFVGDLRWPTVEAVAVLLARLAGHVLCGMPTVQGARVERVVVRETATNTAECRP